MDRLTHLSLTNCIKELDSLSKLALSGNFSNEQLADYIEQISWELSNVFNRRRYDSDEFQLKLKKLLLEKTKIKTSQKPDSEEDDI